VHQYRRPSAALRWNRSASHGADLLALVARDLWARRWPSHWRARRSARYALDTTRTELARLATPGDLKWGEVPPVLAAGAKLAVLDGDPGKAGNYTVRIQMPDGYKIMPHWHPTTERVTVISGEFHAGMGDKLDENGAMTFPPGGYAVMPARMHHFAFAKGETVVQVSGMGPFTLVYVNATDDPSGMQGKKKAAPKKAAAKAGN